MVWLEACNSVYTFGDYPRDPILLEKLRNTVDLFVEKADAIRIPDLAISRYNQRYLREHFERLSSLLKRISYLFAWVLRDSTKPLGDTVFVEYGAGTGLPCAFAKLLGVGTVIYIDHFEPSCKDAKVIHESFGVQADAYLCGEIKELIEFLRSQPLRCDALISNDCIEHIYDIDSFLLSHRDIPGDQLAVAHASGANTKNPRLALRLSKYQRLREYVGYEVKDGSKPTELAQPYFVVRKQIIAEHAPHLSEEITEKLATHTRGLKKEDILLAVDRYCATGEMPPLPDHPTNTCDPLTGNWAERLHDFDKICAKLAEAGFAARILPGYYGGTTPTRRMITPILNAIMRGLGPAAIYMGHFFTLYGERIPQKTSKPGKV